MRSDLELVTVVISHKSSKAFATLVERHQSAIRRFLRRLLTGDHSTADDLAQDTFLQAYRKISTWRSSGSFVSWLHTIAYRQFLQHVKKQSRLQVVAEPRQEGFDPNNALDAELMAQQLLLLAGPEERVCLVLAHAAGMSHREICNVTGLPLGTIKSHLLRGRQKLQQWLQDYDYSNQKLGESQIKETTHVRKIS